MEYLYTFTSLTVYDYTENLYFLMRFIMASALFGVCEVNYDILGRIFWRMYYSMGVRYYLVILTRCYLGR